jgi:hypothetical protein
MKIPRRFLQYRLRTLLLVMTFAAVYASLWSYRIRMTPANVSANLRLRFFISNEKGHRFFT